MVNGCWWWLLFSICAGVEIGCRGLIGRVVIRADLPRLLRDCGDKLIRGTAIPFVGVRIRGVFFRL